MKVLEVKNSMIKLYQKVINKRDYFYAGNINLFVEKGIINRLFKMKGRDLKEIKKGKNYLWKDKFANAFCGELVNYAFSKNKLTLFVNDGRNVTAISAKNLIDIF